MAVAGTKTTDRIKLGAKRLSNGVLNPVFSLADNYISESCLW